MKLLTVIQHTSAEYLGLMEDHFEGRKIRFAYHRPFASNGKLPHRDSVADALVLLGGGPWGSVGERILPGLTEEVTLARTCLMLEKPVIGIGLGAQILSLAAGGKVSAAPLEFRVGYANSVVSGALNGFLPACHPHVVYMRDRPEPPAYAQILARDWSQRPAIFQIGRNAFGFAGHPGFKLAIAEDLVMEFDDCPADPHEQFAALAKMKKPIEDALVPLMTGLIQIAGLMDG